MEYKICLKRDLSAQISANIHRNNVWENVVSRFWVETHVIVVSLSEQLHLFLDLQLHFLGAVGFLAGYKGSPKLHTTYLTYCSNNYMYVFGIGKLTVYIF